MQMFSSCTSHLSLVIDALWILYLNYTDDLKSWVAQSFPQLNQDKTEMLFGPADNSAAIIIIFGPLSLHLTPHTKNIGVFFDSGLKFDLKKCPSCQHKLLPFEIHHLLKSFLSVKDLEIMVHAILSPILL